MGKVTGVNNLSVIGHEYGHVISNKMVEWFEQGIDRWKIEQLVKEYPIYIQK